MSKEEANLVRLRHNASLIQQRPCGQVQATFTQKPRNEKNQVVANELGVIFRKHRRVHSTLACPSRLIISRDANKSKTFDILFL